VGKRTWSKLKQVLLKGVVMKNEKGYVIVAVLGILAILTIIGVSALQISITEQKIAFNHLIYEKNFYAAESGIAITPLWLKENLSESDYMNVDYIGEFDMPIGKGNHFTVEIEHETMIDPVDGIEKVILWGDENGDYMNESNFTTGMPFEISYSEGTHVRGGKSNIRATFKYEWIFAMPDAALRVHENVNGNGVSGSIIGENPSGGSCGDVADIMYDVAGGTIDYSGDMGDTPVISESGGMYPYPIMRDNLIKSATQVLTPLNGKVDPSAIITSESDPGIIFITGDTKITNLTGYGILIVDGNYDCSGNLDWNGLIIVGGDLVLSGGGSKIIYGSVVAMGNAVAINGSVDIQYDCSVLSDLQEDFSRYKMTSWNDTV
jgi:hypothetical protein